MKKKTWLLPPKYDMEKLQSITRATGVSELIAQIMLNRKISEPEAIKKFLLDKAHYHNPFLLKDVEKAANRIISAIAKKEKIVIYGDYDVDGICSTALLYRFFKKLGAENLTYYIPERKKEGYGLNSVALSKLSAAGNSLIITVDCGISNFAEVEKLDNKVDIIITDHHQPPEKLPSAFAIINPTQAMCNYPFKKLAGVGVVYKLCQAIWQIVSSDKTGIYEELLELVALATVADIVALQDENRDFVKQGLRSMTTTKIIGLQQLIRVSRLENKKIDAGKIGFVLAPRLNAAGRLGSAALAVKLLTTEDENIAQEIAEFLNSENEVRQNIEKEILLAAIKMLDENPPKYTIVLAHESWNAGVIGIVASRLVEKYYLPTIIFSIDENGIAKGSCRSIKALDMHKALSSMQELFLSFGGHHQAAGLSIETEKIACFARRFEEYVQAQLVPADFSPKIKIDAIVDDLKSINQELMGELEKLEPFGEGNPRPNMAMYNLSIVNKRLLADKRSLDFSLHKYDIFKNAVFWREADKFSWLKPKDYVNIVFTLSIVDWRDPIQVTLKDLKKNIELIDYRGQEFKLQHFTDSLRNKELLIYAKDSKGELTGLPIITSLFDFKKNCRKLIFLTVPTKKEFEFYQQDIAKCPELSIIAHWSLAELDEKIMKLKKQQIDREKMKKFFILLRQELQLSDKISISVLTSKPWFNEFDEEYLTILQELDLIYFNDKSLHLKEEAIKSKKELSNSQTFLRRNTENMQEQRFLQNFKMDNVLDVFLPVC